jgi:hypothetical protein
MPLMIACGIYAAALLLFFLFPFDFALSAEDFRERAAVLPHMVLSWPGEGLPITRRVLVVMADAAATIPLGVLLALRSRRRSLVKDCRDRFCGDVDRDGADDARAQRLALARSGVLSHCRHHCRRGHCHVVRRAGSTTLPRGVENDRRTAEC